MTFTEGADTVALKNSARTLGEAGRGLNDTRRRIDSTLLELLSAWHGPDARDFQRAWRAECEPALARTVQSVGAMVDLLLANIGEQDQASGGGSSAAAGAPWNGEGTTRDRRVDASNASELLRFADDSYHNGSGKNLPTGWHRLDQAELAKLGISPGELNRRDGFQAAIYTNEEGKYVLAFAGTQDLRDWGTNIAQGVGGAPPAYLQAARLSSKLGAAVGTDNLVLTGHSQGGGLAATAAMTTGASAYTFNAAGVNSHILDALALRNPDARAHSSSLVHNYYVKGEPLSGFEHLHVGPPAVGTQYEMPAVLDEAARGRIHDAAVKGADAGARIGRSSNPLHTPFLPDLAEMAGSKAGYEIGETVQTEIERHVQSGVRSSMDAYLKKLDGKG